MKNWLLCLCAAFTLAFSGLAHAQTFTLTVNSTNPSSGVAIVAQTPDNNGSTGGNTSSLALVYNAGTYAEVTAPPTAGSPASPFSSWTGCYYTSGLMCLVQLNSNVTVVVNYGGTTASVVHPGASYTFPAANATGPIAPYLNFTQINPPQFYPPTNMQVDWSITGTAPSVCTAEVDGSSDGANWYVLATGITCTAVGHLQVNAGPALNLRIRVLTYTGTSDSVTFNWTSGGALPMRPNNY